MTWPIVLLLSLIVLGTLCSAAGAVYSVIQLTIFVRAELNKWEQQ